MAAISQHLLPVHWLGHSSAQKSITPTETALLPVLPQPGLCAISQLRPDQQKGARIPEANPKPSHPRKVAAIQGRQGASAG